MTTMIVRLRSYRVAPLVIGALLLSLFSACSSGPPKSDKARMTVSATADANPAADGRASPIVLRIYQLKEDAKFNNATFFALFDSDQQTLGSDLLAREEVELNPGEQRQVEFEVAGEAKYVGVMAAYRDIRNAQWRTTQAAPKKGLLNLVKKDAIMVTAGRAAVTVQIRD
jgi:type VI secretion system protein VasD